MDENLRHQRDASLGQLETLIRRGREIRNARSVDATRAWQRDCAAAINQLSGGSKAHWLARAYSGAFMVRSTDGAVVVEADATEIVDRILDVLAQGGSSLSRMDDVEAASSGAAPRPRRFEFVHNAELRPVFEQAFDDSHRALERGQCGLALILSCGVIEALLTYETKLNEMTKWRPDSVQHFKQAAELADRHYRLGAVPISTYVELQKQYLEAVESLLDTKKEALEAAAQLERLTGLSMPLANASATEEKP